MPVVRRLVPAALLLTLAGHAPRLAAQHCWPAQLALEVRGSAGAIIGGESFDSFDYAPQPGRGRDFAVAERFIDPRNPGAAQGMLPALLWTGRGDCRIELREVVLRRGRDEMRLWLDLLIDTARDPGPSAYTLQTPRFAAGTWRLDRCAFPPGRVGQWTAIRGRWVRVRGTPRQRPAVTVCAPGGA